MRHTASRRHGCWNPTPAGRAPAMEQRMTAGFRASMSQVYPCWMMSWYLKPSGTSSDHQIHAQICCDAGADQSRTDSKASGTTVAPMR